MTTAQTADLTKRSIEALNQKALALRAQDNSVEWSLNVAAVELGFTHIVKSSDDAEVLENSQGIRVNCWFEGMMSQEIQDGGAGFDDYIEWIDEDDDDDSL